MPYEIHPVTPADASGVAEANMRAFAQDPHWRLLWPGMTLESIIDGNRLRLPRSLTKNRETLRHQMAVDAATGEVVAYARWALLNVDEEFSGKFWLDAQVAEATEEEAEKYEKSWKEGTDARGRPLGVNSVMMSELGGPLEVDCNKITAGKPYLELDHLGTLPSHGRRGVGGLLLESGIKEADAAGIPVFVMAYPHGVGLYQKHGFELMGTSHRDDSKYGGDGTHVVSFFVRKVGGGP